MTARGQLLLRLAALVGMVVLAFGWLLVGRVDTSATRLERAIADGDVDSVELAGGLDQPYLGFTTVEARWRLHGIARSTRFTEVHCRNGTTSCPAAQGASGTRTTDVAAELRTLAPGLRIARSDADPFTAPGRTTLELGTLAIGMLVLLTLVAGPEPRLATRWAWFWIMSGVPVVGGVAFTLLGAPWRASAYLPPGVRPTGGRLTGGWAFLLCSIPAAVVGSLNGWLLGHW